MFLAQPLQYLDGLCRLAALQVAHAQVVEYLGLVRLLGQGTVQDLDGALGFTQGAQYTAQVEASLEQTRVEGQRGLVGGPCPCWLARFFQ